MKKLRDSRGCRRASTEAGGYYVASANFGPTPLSLRSDRGISRGKSYPIVRVSGTDAFHPSESASTAVRILSQAGLPWGGI